MGKYSATAAQAVGARQMDLGSLDMCRTPGGLRVSDDTGSGSIVSV